jgi:hypothetical protein
VNFFKKGKEKELKEKDQFERKKENGNKKREISSVRKKEKR